MWILWVLTVALLSSGHAFIAPLRRPRTGFPQVGPVHRVSTMGCKAVQPPWLVSPRTRKLSRIVGASLGSYRRG